MNSPINRTTAQRVPSQRLSPQQNNLRKNYVNSVKTSPAQLLKSTTLLNTQKIMVHNLISILSAIPPKTSPNLKNFNRNPTLFNLIPPPDNLFSKTEIVSLVAQSEICTEGKESEFVDSLIEICAQKPEHQESAKNIEQKTLPLPAKKLLNDLNIEEKPVVLKKINLILEQIARSPTAVSDELKKKLLDILKDTEEDDEIEDLKFDYAEISEVIT